MLAKNLPALNLRSKSKNMSFSTCSLFFLEIGQYLKKKKKAKSKCIIYLVNYLKSTTDG